MTWIFWFDPSATYRYFCWGSFDNAISNVDPSTSVFFSTTTSFTNVPSVLNTWMRSFVRSQTYNNPSLASATQCTGVRNCWAGGSLGLYLPIWVSRSGEHTSELQ